MKATVHKLNMNGLMVLQILEEYISFKRHTFDSSIPSNFPVEVRVYFDNEYLKRVNYITEKKQCNWYYNLRLDEHDILSYKTLNKKQNTYFPDRFFENVHTEILKAVGHLSKQNKKQE